MADVQRRFSERLRAKNNTDTEGMNEQVKEFEDTERLLTENGNMGEKDQAQTGSIHDIKIAGRTFNKVILVTHLNIFLYSTCFWIQIGTLPVSIFLHVNFFLSYKGYVGPMSRVTSRALKDLHIIMCLNSD